MYKEHPVKDFWGQKWVLDQKNLGYNILGVNFGSRKLEPLVGKQWLYKQDKDINYGYSI